MINYVTGCGFRPDRTLWWNIVLPEVFYLTVIFVGEASPETEGL